MRIQVRSERQGVSPTSMMASFSNSVCASKCKLVWKMILLSKSFGSCFVSCNLSVVLKVQDLGFLPTLPFILPSRLKKAVPAPLLPQPQWDKQRYTASRSCHCYKAMKFSLGSLLWVGLHVFSLHLDTHTHRGDWFDSWCSQPWNFYSSTLKTSTAGSRNGLTTTV